jgi:hypothetical protein
LRPFYDVTRLMCSSSHLSLSWFGAVVNNLLSMCAASVDDRQVAGMLKFRLSSKVRCVVNCVTTAASLTVAVIRQIRERFLDPTTSKTPKGIVALASYLDPRTKSLANLPVEWQDAANAVAAKVVALAAKLGADVDRGDVVEAAGVLPGAAAPAPSPADVLLGSRKRDAADMPTPEAKRAALEAQQLLLFTVGQASAAAQASTLAAEIELYNREGEIAWTDDPLAWWRNNQRRFPRLARVARAVLCIQATSCPSECVFSKAGILLQGRRSLLAPKNVDMMIFLHDNCEHFE